MNWTKEQKQEIRELFEELVAYQSNANLKDTVYVFLKEKGLTEPNIEITVKINGKESKLSDISEDTLKKIMKNE